MEAELAAANAPRAEPALGDTDEFPSLGSQPAAPTPTPGPPPAPINPSSLPSPAQVPLPHSAYSVRLGLSSGGLLAFVVLCWQGCCWGLRLYSIWLY